MGGASQNELQYWNVNVPRAERTETCPDFLENLSAKDRRIVGTPDEQYQQLEWADVKSLAAHGQLGLFRRKPSDLRRYLEFMWSLKRQYGSVEKFLLEQRLGWKLPVRPRGAAFQYDDDIRVLRNDWPYGIDPRIVHLVVWTKCRLKEEPGMGVLTEEARRQVDNYVSRVFCSSLPRDRVVWFKNWAALRSVAAVEHFHVLLFDPDPDFVEEVTADGKQKRVC